MCGAQSINSAEDLMLAARARRHLQLSRPCEDANAMRVRAKSVQRVEDNMAKEKTVIFDSVRIWCLYFVPQQSLIFPRMYN